MSSRVRQGAAYQRAREATRRPNPFAGRLVSSLSREERLAISDQDRVDDRLRGLDQARFSDRLLDEVAEEGGQWLRQLFEELTSEQLGEQPYNYHGIVTGLSIAVCALGAIASYSC